jgi:hypothetical protein
MDDNATREPSRAQGYLREFVVIRQQRLSRVAQGVRFKSLDSCIVLPEYPQTNRWYGSCSFFLLPKLSRQNG